MRLLEGYLLVQKFACKAETISVQISKSKNTWKKDKITLKIIHLRTKNLGVVVITSLIFNDDDKIFIWLMNLIDHYPIQFGF